MILWVIALSRTNTVFILSLKWIFFHTSATHFSIIFSLFHTFFIRIKELFSTHFICSNFISVSLPSFELKIYKDASFSSDVRVFKITVILQFSCPSVLINLMFKIFKLDIKLH